jgi:sestrin 1/3
MLFSVGNVEKLLCFFPTFCSKFTSTFNFIMKGPGPLPYYLRNYLAILAASRYDCTYLIKNQEYEFLENNGDPEWLDGVEFAPKKIKNILEFNSILGMKIQLKLEAHQPWMLNVGHVESLLKVQQQEDSWTISEIVHSILIFSLFYGYSGIVQGLGILNEFENFSSYDSIQGDAESEEEENLRVVEKLKGFEEEDPEEDRVSLFDKSESFQSNSFIEQINNLLETKKYIQPFQLQYKDFEVNIKNYKVHNYRDYSWKDHAFSILNRFYHGSQDLLDSEFDYIYYMTEKHFNSEKNVDTSRFRHAIWYFVFSPF